MMPCLLSPVGSWKSASRIDRAATITTAKLMIRVTSNAKPHSATLYLYADFSARSPRENVRLNTSALCRNKLCGITTAPRSEMAMNNALGSLMTGATMPTITSPPSPPPRRLICATKQIDMTPTSAPMNASSLRTPKLCSPKNSSVESEVTPTPQAVGRPKISFSARAVPITSGMSLATMASSVATQSAYRTRGGYSSRITRAKCHPVASARRTHMACTNSPASVAQSNTQSSE
mmetsp:Transcript_1208/g.4808  ORF Transcript_1208/g.4808 Transcript_1208/m.4808 type:complete len:234 (+) Transcript_1208:3744-4445(+)